MKELVNSYVDWIRDSLTLRDVGNGWHEIVTPFLNHRNDMIELYLRQEGEEIVLSDGGNTINELTLSGTDINRSQKKTEELNNILRSFGIQKNAHNEISARTSAKKFPQVKHRFIQAIISVDDMFMLSTPKIESFFTEEVSSFFELNEIIFIKDISFVGKSGFTHKFDFTLPKMKGRKEVAIKAINKPRKTSIGGVMWMIEDTKILRPDTDGLVILNDEEEISSDIYQALEEYKIPHLSWKNRSEAFSQLKVAA